MSEIREKDRNKYRRKRKTSRIITETREWLRNICWSEWKKPRNRDIYIYIYIFWWERKKEKYTNKKEIDINIKRREEKAEAHETNFILNLKLKINSLTVKCSAIYQITPLYTQRKGWSTYSSKRKRVLWWSIYIISLWPYSYRRHRWFPRLW